MSKNIKITFVVNNKNIVCKTQVGKTLLQTAQDNNIPLGNACEGNGVCGMCHVLIEQDNFKKFKKPSTKEEDVLEKLLNVSCNSRLACQTILTSNCADIVVTVS